MKKTLLFAVVALFIIAGLVMSADVPKDKDVITLKSKKGDVTFTHSKHMAAKGVTCTTCHHTYKEGDTVKSCHACHGVDENAPKVMKAFHKQCRDCHKKAEGKKAPTKCKECHIKK